MVRGWMGWRVLRLLEGWAWAFCLRDGVVSFVIGIEGDLIGIMLQLIGQIW